MTIEFTCPNCQKAYKVKDELAGKRATCTGCKMPLIVPVPGQTSPPPQTQGTAAASSDKPAPPPVKKPAPAPRPAPDTIRSDENGPVAKPVEQPAPPATKKMPRVPAPTAKSSPAPSAEKFAGAKVPTSKPVEKTDPASTPADKPPAAPPGREADTVKFNCPQCDEEIQVPSSLAGKQAPCPACQRIIKVPLPTKRPPTEWHRLAETSAAAPAQRDEKVTLPAGWSPGAASPAASKPAAPQAAAEESEPLTRLQRITRYGKMAAGISVVVVGAWLIYYYLGQSKQQKMMARALQYVEAPASDAVALPNPAAAEIYRAAGQFYLRRGDPEEAVKQLGNARRRLQDGDDSSEYDAALIDLALAQIELGGSADQVKKGTRLSWDAAQKEVQGTLQYVRSSEARAEANREVTRELVAKGQAPVAIALARRSNASQEVADLLAVVALELLRAGDRPTAETVAEEALERYGSSKPAPVPPEPPPAEKPPADDAGAAADPPKPPAAAEPKLPDPQMEELPPGFFPSSLVALGLALNQADKIDGLKPGKAATKTDTIGWTMGRAEGLARQGKHDAARSLVSGLGSPVERLQALVAMADAGDGKSPDARTVEQALGLVGKDVTANRDLPSWALFRLVRLADQAGLTEQAKQLAAAIPDPYLRGRAQLSLFRARLEKTTTPAEESSTEAVDNETPAHALAREALARHNTRLGGAGDVLKSIETWQPETLRPFGYAGVALGMQGAGR